MISQLSAKYQIGAIHTAILCDGLSPNPSEKVHRLYPPSIVQTQSGDTLNRCSRRFQVVSWPTWPYHTLKPDTHSNRVPDGFRLCLDLTWPNLTVLHTQTGYTLKPWHRHCAALGSSLNTCKFDQLQPVTLIGGGLDVFIYGCIPCLISHMPFRQWLLKGRNDIEGRFSSLFSPS